MTTELIGAEPPHDPVAGDAEEPAVADFDRIGPYRVVQHLGEGGMGVVHLALDQKGRAVALKVLRPHVAHDTDARNRLRREVDTLARIRSPRVAPVFDADLDGDQPYIVTRYVPGPSLDAYVKEHGPLDGEQLLRLGRGMAEAVRAIHEAGVVHRDLKPGNVLLVDGDPVVIDFGIAHDAESSRMTMTGLVMGTPGYLPPEIIEGGDVDAATDWWGWAATLVFAASGHAPFGRGGMEAVLSRVMRGDVDLSGVDERLAPLLYAALNPDSARRPHADEVLAALERYAQGRPTTEALPVRARALPDPRQARQVAATTQLPSAGSTAYLPAAQTPARQVQPAPQPAQHAWVDPFAGQPPRQPTPAPVERPQQWPGTVASEREGDPRIGLPRRTEVLLALLLLVVGGAATAPLLTLCVALVASVVARTVDRSMTATVMRRYSYGRRRGDAAVAAAKSPLHLLGAVGSTLLSLILPAVVGVSAVVVTGLALWQLDSSGTGGTGSPFEHPLALAAGGLVTALVTWWGPGSPSLRRGARSLVRTVTGVPPVRVALTVALALLGLWLLGAAVTAGQAWTWWPLTGSPVPDSSWLPTR